MIPLPNDDLLVLLHFMLCRHLPAYWMQTQRFVSLWAHWAMLQFMIAETRQAYARDVLDMAAIAKLPGKVASLRWTWLSA